jgi:hypothetical protein
MTIVTPQVVTASVVSAGQVSALAVGASSDTAGLITMTLTPVTMIPVTDLAPSYQGVGGHTLYGAALHYTPTAAMYIEANGVGVVPTAPATAEVVQLSGGGPWTAAEVAEACASVLDGLGVDVTDNLDGTLSVVTANPAAVVAAQDALTDYDGRGGGGLIGAEQQAGGGNAPSNGTGWQQVLPDRVPAGPWRAIGIEIFRGSTVTNNVMVAVATGGAGDGDPEGAIVAAEMSMGNSGTVAWHRQFFPEEDVPYFDGGERVFVGMHGDGNSSRVYGGSSINAGLFDDGSGNTLWLTDGTTGGTTPFVSPAGAVTSALNYGILCRLIIQEAPYQENGDYTAIAGAVEGVHDQDLFPTETELENLFVAWGLRLPALQGMQIKRTRVNFVEYGGAGNTKRLELWNEVGGTSTFVGDTLIAGWETADDQGTGWSDIPHSPISVALSAEIRLSLKGETSTGTRFGVAVGGFGGSVAGHPIYSLQGGPLEDEELEVQADLDETAINFDPSTATTSPNNADGTVITPGNVGMWQLRVGPPAPAVTAEES